MKGVKYGLTKNHVLGLEFLLTDGRMTRTGAPAEDRGGPDLTGIFLASEGAFAFITRALLKITPLPQSFRTVLAVFDDLENSDRTVAGIIAAGIIPTAMEIMDHEMIQALEDFLHLGFSRQAQAMVLIEVDGLGPELGRPDGPDHEHLPGLRGHRTQLGRHPRRARQALAGQAFRQRGHGPHQARGRGAGRDRAHQQAAGNAQPHARTGAAA